MFYLYIVRGRILKNKQIHRIIYKFNNITLTNGLILLSSFYQNEDQYISCLSFSFVLFGKSDGSNFFQLKT